MTEENIKKLTALQFEDLPAELEGFAIKKICAADGDKYIFFTCADDAIHSAVTIYFHEETSEFKVRQSIGLTEFCLTDFFTTDFEDFKEFLRAKLGDVLKNLRGLRSGNFNRFLRKMKLDTWAYGRSLPATLEGFKLFINPAAPVEVTNGSFIIVNYADFALGSDFVLYGNVYTDSFGSEERIRGATRVTYDFDAVTLDELEDKLKSNLAGELQTIRRLSEG